MHSQQQLCSKLLHCRSIQAAIRCIADVLGDSGVETPQLEARLLAEHCGGFSHEGLLLSLQACPSEDMIARAAALLDRRLSGEPLQYVLGEAWFYGRRFAVDSRVLIPRPETELAVDAILSLSDQMPRRNGHLYLLDVGTGSGALAATLAEEIGDSRVVACDISFQALQLARSNLRQCASGARVSLLRCDLGAAVAGIFGCVVANLPYIPTAEMRTLSREILAYEPHGALDGGVDGLVVIRRMVSDARQLLLAGGWLVLEVGYGQAEQVAALMTGGQGWANTRVTSDFAGIPRLVASRWNGRETNPPCASDGQCSQPIPWRHRCRPAWR